MSEQEIKDIWMNTGNGENINLDLPLLVVNLKNKMKKNDRVLFFRDAREIVAAVFVMLFFGYKAYEATSSGTMVAHISIILWCIYVIYRLLDVRKYKKIGDLNNSFKTQLLQQKMFLQKQAGLLDSALSWYIAPPIVIGLAFIIIQGYPDNYHWMTILVYVVFAILVGWGLYVLNKKASKTAFQPLIENIDKVLIQLDEDIV